ncbi:hypothetical protein LSAT2_026681, partial [Lamellibrachia satsuma]
TLKFTVDPLVGVDRGQRDGTMGLLTATVHSLHGHRRHISWSSDLSKPMRRSVAGMDKRFLCNYSGCDKAFYDRKNLLRHQTLKHGRKPVVTRMRFKSHDGSPDHNI